jgi:hydrogenase-4 component B
MQFMPPVSSLLTGTIAFWLVSCLVVIWVGKNVRHKYPSLALLLGALAMIVASVLGWGTDITWNAAAPVYLAVAPLSSRLDSLSSIFIGLLAIITISISLFSPGYLQHLGKDVDPASYWVQLFLFVIGMLGMILAANALSFLLAWEIVSLASLLLIATNLSSHESRTAAFIYLVATRIATAFLMAGFLWLYSISHSWNFLDWRYYSGQATDIPALLILIALCIKSGIWPFHGWLPYAHPTSPSPVSALMSGVMIKLSLYAIVRMLVMNDLGSPWLGYIMLALGMISTFWGVLYALMQHDLKRLLAYHSIENVGLILSAIGMALISHRLHQPLLADLSLAAAIYHCVNHGLFKSLLFLGAGSIDSRARTRDLDVLGGLGKIMPWTMLFFFIGSAAICALPPLNGFNSKWLVYQSLFQLAYKSNSLWIAAMSVACIGVLALVSGMALACFTKAFAIAFLGRPRSQEAANASEGDVYMRMAQGLLAICCLILGINAPLAIATIQPICHIAFSNCEDMTSAYKMPMAAFAIALILLTLIVYFWLTMPKKGVRTYITWECGYGELSKRMQGTAASFAENIAYTFHPVIQYRRWLKINGRDRRHFPESINQEVSMTPLLESWAYKPVVRAVRWLSYRMSVFQAGSVHLYLGYVMLTLVALMLIGVLV